MNQARSLSTSQIDSEARVGFTVSSYEQVASWIVALLVLVGFCVFALVLMWLTSRAHVPVRLVPVELVEVSGGGDMTVGQGSGGALEAPNLEDLARQPELMTNSLPQLMATLPSAIARRKVAPSTQNLSGDPNTSGTGGGGGGPGSGPGKGEGRSGFTRADRWEIRLSEGISLEEYARRLDYFNIELGLVGPSPEILYVSRFRSKQPNQRTAPREADQRLFLSWRQGSLRQADIDLVTRAGVNVNNRIILQFIPPELEEQLAQIEHKHAGRQPHEIRRTQFVVQPRGTGFEFVVIEQLALTTK